MNHTGAYTRIMCLVFLLILAAGSASADTKSVNDFGLFFGLDQDTTFIRVSTDSTSFETARLTFSLMFGLNGEPVPMGDFTGANFIFTFDSSRLTFVGADAVGPWTVQATLLSSGRVWIQIFGDPVEPPRDNPMPLAELKFYAWCQPEKSANPVTFDRIMTYATVGNVPYTANPSSESNWQDGSVNIADYVGDFEIDSVDVSPGDTTGYDREVTVAVNATTNFRIQDLQHEIEYDTTRLEFLGVDLGDIDWQYFIDPPGEPQQGDYPITVALAADYYVGAGPFYESTALYYLRFRIKPDIKWDGETTAIRFGEHSQLCMHGGSGFACPEALADDPPVTYNPGAVTLERYSAQFKAVPLGNDIRLDGDGTFAYVFQLMNRFYAGMPEDDDDYRGNITFAVQLDSSVTATGKTDVDEALDFRLTADAKSSTRYASAYQLWDETRTNFWPAQEDLRDAVRIDFRYDGPLPTSYTQRFISPFSFVHENPGLTYGGISRVTDLFGYQQADSANNRLTWQVEPLEIDMGEWNGTGGYNKVGPTVGGVIRIRNNVDLSDFSISVITSPEFVISGLVLSDSVTTAPLRCFTSCRRLVPVPGVVFPATGDSWRTIATITYHTASGCIPGHLTGGSVTFANVYMTDTEGRPVHAVGSSTVSLCARCGPGIVPDTLAAEAEEIRRKPAGALPTRFALHANYPNPFNPTTSIQFDLPSACHVTLDIFNIAGQKVATIIDRSYEAGIHTVEWNGRSSAGQQAASGIYLYRIVADDFIQTRKMMLLK